MDDYISRQAAFDAFNKLDYDICANETFDNLRGYYGFSEETVNQTINSIPAADVRPVVRGKWIRYRNFKSHYCSECMKDAPIDFDTQTELLSRFCPYCGAMMMEE